MSPCSRAWLEPRRRRAPVALRVLRLGGGHGQVHGGRRAHCRRPGRNRAGASGARHRPIGIGGHLSGQRPRRPSAAGHPAARAARLSRTHWPALARGFLESGSSASTRELRHQILPVLERELQPAIVDHLGRLAQMAREDEAFWTALVAERLGRWLAGPVERRGANRSPEASAARICWRRCPGPPAQTNAGLALTGRIVRGIVAELRGECREITAQHVEQVLHLACTGSSGQSTELPGIVAERAFDWLWFAETPANTTSNGRELSSAQPEPPGSPGRKRGRGATFSNASAFSYEIALCARGSPPLQFRKSAGASG